MVLSFKFNFCSFYPENKNLNFINLKTSSLHNSKFIFLPKFSTLNGLKRNHSFNKSKILLQGLKLKYIGKMTNKIQLCFKNFNVFDLLNFSKPIKLYALRKLSQSKTKLVFQVLTTDLTEQGHELFVSWEQLHLENHIKQFKGTIHELTDKFSNQIKNRKKKIWLYTQC